MQVNCVWGFFTCVYPQVKIPAVAEKMQLYQKTIITCGKDRMEGAQT